ALTLSKIVEADNGEIIPSKLVRELTQRRLSEFDSRNLKILTPDEGISLLSIYGHVQEYGKWLYMQPDGKVGVGMLMPDQFGSWFGHLMQQLVPDAFQGRIDEDRTYSISSAVYELLENALNHGRLDKFATPIRTGVCGLSVRTVKCTFDDVNPL